MTDIQILEELKKILGLSFNSLAKEVGLKSPQIFYDIKAGKCGISKDLATKIHEKFLNVNMAWLLTGEGDMLNAAPVQVQEKADDSAITLALNMLNEQLKVKDEQIAKLHQLLEIRLKGDVHEDAACADVG